MILIKRIIESTKQYQWTDINNQPVSDWMDLDNALQWIIKHDEEKETQWK
jgi:hypothetical protein